MRLIEEIAPHVFQALHERIILTLAKMVLIDGYAFIAHTWKLDENSVILKRFAALLTRLIVMVLSYQWLCKGSAVGLDVMTCEQNPRLLSVLGPPRFGVNQQFLVLFLIGEIWSRARGFLSAYSMVFFRSHFRTACRSLSFRSEPSSREQPQG